MTDSGLRMVFSAGMVFSIILPAPAAGPPRCIEPRASTGSSSAVVVEDVPLVHTAQLRPRHAAATATGQLQLVLRDLDGVLRSAGSSLNDVVKLNVFVRTPSVTAAVEQHLAELYPGPHGPAVSFVVADLPNSTDVPTDVALDAVAVSSRSGLKEVERLPPREAGKCSPAAILPAGPRVYISGQAEQGDGTLADATRRTMESLFATLEWLELSPADVVEIKTFLQPMEQESVAVAEIVRAFGDQTTPPISVVGWVSSLPIEIELVAAARPRDDLPPVAFLTPPGMTASPVFARVVRVSAPGTIYFSGLYGSTDEPNGEAEVQELFSATKRIASASGTDLHHLVKATYYVSNDDVSRWHNQLRPQYYDPQRPPAASKAMVSGTGRERRTITWDMIAVPKPQ
ncbi:MAG: RidA family protein [Planctomycetaceae bacterium]